MLALLLVVAAAFLSRDVAAVVESRAAARPLP